MSLDNRENRLRNSSIQIEKAKVQFSNSVVFKSTRQMLNGSSSLASDSVLKFDLNKTQIGIQRDLRWYKSLLDS